MGSVGADTPAEIVQSLRGRFHFRTEDPSADVPGLREPQAGALHSILGYWTTTDLQPCNVVMPTGTGKTETMLAAWAAAQIPRLLVLVPSDALRDQIAEKFEGLGVLQENGVVDWSALRPIVGRVSQRFSSSEDAISFAGQCNVVVSTPAALLSANSAELRRSFLEKFTHLFVDEAHHVAARTWQLIRDDFRNKPIVQFTATPFREDGRHLGGRQIFSYPLREAQSRGFFSRIDYESVINFEHPDHAIAESALTRLRQDLAAGFDHILMARVRYIPRLEKLLAIYQALAPDMAPVILHSRLPRRDRDAALHALRERETRVVICVDMLGEGFDLASLKVAAIHDQFKSLGVTLQFIGRFARVSTSSIGTASVFVGRPEPGTDHSLRSLYAENADWNVLIRNLSQDAVQTQQEVSEFEEAFNTTPEEVTLRNLLPKMSAVVYRTYCEEWDPFGAYNLFHEDALLTNPIAVNQVDRVAWFVTRIESQVRWGDIRTLQEVSFDLYVLYWDLASGLLFINSSNNDSLHEELAFAVSGGSAVRITGETVYRSMAHLLRLVPTNVGLLDVRSMSRRFSMHVGVDVTEGFPVAEAQTKSKTNIFAYGYETGNRVSAGASLKGRLWSHRVAPSLKHWMDWCDAVGRKLLDESISVDEIMQSFIRPEVVDGRPELIPLAIEWPWDVLSATSEDQVVSDGQHDWPLIDIDYSIVEPSSSGPIKYSVSSPHWVAEFELTYSSGGAHITSTQNSLVMRSARKEESLAGFTERVGLLVHFEQDAVVVPPGLLLRPERELPGFEREELRVVDWSGINLRVESQGPERRSDSIQARMVAEVLQLDEWIVVIDDDGAGEMADIVAVKTSGSDLVVLLCHCKYSSSETPGSRVQDLYEVCGQAQKSVHWRRNVERFLSNLIRREVSRWSRHGKTGLLVGSAQDLYDIEQRARYLRPRFEVFVAQPGLSAAGATRPVLDLLGSTAVYVQEVAGAPLRVYCNT